LVRDSALLVFSARAIKSASAPNQPEASARDTLQSEQKKGPDGGTGGQV